jgi:imidazole glycerol-phosphate synthase subunit HisH
VKRRVVIIDNGGANTASLCFALERLDAEPELTSDARVIEAATHVILPGVGAAADAMERLRLHGLHTLIPKLTQPVLGICLGMQLLYQASEEGGAQCLGTIAGTARRLHPVPGRPVPHMGWNQIRRAAAVELLAGVEDGAHAYFVHSYALPVGSETVAVADYGEEFSAVIAHENFFGTQFHPERSAQTGATILGNFLAMH